MASHPFAVQEFPRFCIENGLKCQFDNPVDDVQNPPIVPSRPSPKQWTHLTAMFREVLGSKVSLGFDSLVFGRLVGEVLRAAGLVKNAEVAFQLLESMKIKSLGVGDVFRSLNVDLADPITVLGSS